MNSKSPSEDDNNGAARMSPAAPLPARNLAARSLFGRTQRRAIEALLVRLRGPSQRTSSVILVPSCRHIWTAWRPPI